LIQFLKGYTIIKDFVDIGIEPSNLRIIIIGVLLILSFCTNPMASSKKERGSYDPESEGY